MSPSGVLPRQLSPRNRHSVQDRTLGTLVHHYRIVAACTGAFGEPELVELAIQADWGAALLGLYLRRGKVVEITPNLHAGLWAT